MASGKDMDDIITFSMRFSIKKRWVPVFLGFLNKLFTLSKEGRSALIGFYADGKEDFRFNAKIGDDWLLKKTFGKKDWLGDEVFDTEKICAKPVAENVKIPGLFGVDEMEALYDAR